MMKTLVRSMIRRLGYDVVSLRPPRSIGSSCTAAGNTVPDIEFYTPKFSPWNGYGPFSTYGKMAAPRSLVTPESCWVLYSTVLQCLHLPGDVWECGVYKGGTARMLAQVMADSSRLGTKKLHLFDTFAGMPETDSTRDWHRAGDFSDTCLAAVQSHVGHDQLVGYHPGLIPQTFAGLEHTRISFAHIDVDIYHSIKDCCAFVLPRLVVGGIMVFDDYGLPTCPGARQAVDEFFAGTPFIPLVLRTGQAVVFKSCEPSQGSQEPSWK
jgi:O-methyltransferase